VLGRRRQSRVRAHRRLGLLVAYALDTMATSLALVPCASTNRDGLAAALAFLEGSASPGWRVDDLRVWFRRHLVVPGCMTTPLLVTEPCAGTIAFHGATPPNCLLRLILVAARSRVLTAMRGLTAAPVDDRFLAATIFAGRVSRQSVQGTARWVARPEPTAPLSAIVLSLFAVDVLSHRETYDELFGVCDTCDRIGFHRGMRRTCVEHAMPASRVFRTQNARPHS
jgi:hypothetical protein